LEWLRL